MIDNDHHDDDSQVKSISQTWALNIMETTTITKFPCFGEFIYELYE